MSMTVQIGTQKLKKDQYEFVIWAPFAKRISIKIVEPAESIIPLDKEEKGYWRGVSKVKAGYRYYVIIDDKIQHPDPASHFQPDGVYSASEIIDHNDYKWKDSQWQGINPEQTIIYELHVGAFTGGGGFEDMIPKLDHLIELGVNAIEVMPVAQFPGERNWGYDGVFPFAVQNNYGGPEKFKRFIDHCHRKGIAVILDVVYNHLGPEGNCLADFGPYFTEKYKIPWGKAINFDDAWCDGVRNFFIRNALMWFEQYHIDGLRLDAIQTIKDTGAKHFLKELAEETHTLNDITGIKHFLIAESNLNDAQVITPWSMNGYGVDAQWCDDFHHALHAYLTGERQGYYQDFGRIEDLQKTMRDAFVHDWKYSSFRKKAFGNNPEHCLSKQFVVYSQNHDQVGNRMPCGRLSKMLPYQKQKLAAATVILSPYIPLLFMGEEYAEKNPFFYFIDHKDEKLVEAVKRGRKNELRAFGWKEDTPDPQAIDTYKQSWLSWNNNNADAKKTFLFYKSLIALKKEINKAPLLKVKENMVERSGNLFILLHRLKDKVILVLMNFGNDEVQYTMPGTALTYKKAIDSEDPCFGGEEGLPSNIKATDTISLQPHAIVAYGNVVEGQELKG